MERVGRKCKLHGFRNEIPVLLFIMINTVSTVFGILMGRFR
jgi:hypothetical protein